MQPLVRGEALTVLSITAMRDGGGAIGFGRRSLDEAMALAVRLEIEGFVRIEVSDVDTGVMHWPVLGEDAEMPIAA